MGLVGSIGVKLTMYTQSIDRRGEKTQKVTNQSGASNENLVDIQSVSAVAATSK